VRRNGASQAALAQEVGIDRSYWSELERGERNVTLSVLSRMARIFGVRLSHLIERAEREQRRLSAQTSGKSPRTARERAIEAGLKRLRAFMDQSPNMKWLGDAGQKTIYCNPPLLHYMGVTQEELQGSSRWQEFVHPEDLENYLSLRKVYSRRQPFVLRYRFRRAGAGYEWVVEHATPQFTPRGIFIGILGTMIVIPEAEALSALVQNLKKTKTRR